MSGPRNHACSLALALLVSAGCAGPGAGEAQVELGTGTWRFEPLVDGQEVDMVRGAQGGWHIWLGLRATDFDADRALTKIEMQPADESAEPQQVEAELYLGSPDDEGRRTLLGWPAIIADPACAVGEMMRVSVEVESIDGTPRIDERYVILAPGADPPGPCDRPPL